MKLQAKIDSSPSRTLLLSRSVMTTFLKCQQTSPPHTPDDHYGRCARNLSAGFSELLDNIPVGEKSYITSQTYYFMQHHTQKPPYGSTFAASSETYPSLDRFVYFIQSHLLSRSSSLPGILLSTLFRTISAVVVRASRSTAPEAAA